MIFENQAQNNPSESTEVQTEAQKQTESQELADKNALNLVQENIETGNIDEIIENLDTLTPEALNKLNTDQLAQISQLINNTAEKREENKEKFFSKLNELTQITNASPELIQSLASLFDEKQMQTLMPALTRDAISLNSLVGIYSENYNFITKVYDKIKGEDLSLIIPNLNQTTLKALFIEKDKNRFKNEISDETLTQLLNSQLEEGYKIAIYATFLNNLEIHKDKEQLLSLLTFAQKEQDRLDDFREQITKPKNATQYKLVIQSLVNQADGFDFDGKKIRFQTTNPETKETTERSLIINKEEFLPTLLSAKSGTEVKLACYNRLTSYYNNKGVTPEKYTNSNNVIKSEIPKLQTQAAQEETERKANEIEASETENTEEVEKPKETKSIQAQANDILSDLVKTLNFEKAIITENQETGGFDIIIDNLPIIQVSTKENGEILAKYQKAENESPVEKTFKQENLKIELQNLITELKESRGNVEFTVNQYQISEIDKDYTISKEVADQFLNADSLDINHIDNFRLLDSTLAGSPFNISDAGERIATLKAITQEGSNNTIRFKDVMEITKAYTKTNDSELHFIGETPHYGESFKDEYQKLQTSINYLSSKETLNESEQKELSEKTQELSKMHETYLATMKLIKILSESEYKAPEKVDNREKINTLKETNIGVFKGQSYPFENIAPNEKLNGKVSIGVAQNPEELPEFDQSKDQGQFLQEVFKKYTLAKLIDAGCLHQYENATNETLLVLDRLPSSNSEASLRKDLETSISSLYDRQREGITDWGLFSDATDLSERIVRNSNKEYYDISEAQNSLSYEALVDRILSNPDLYEFVDGKKVYDEEKVTAYINELIAKGSDTSKKLERYKNRKLYDVDKILDMTTREIGDEYKFDVSQKTTESLLSSDYGSDKMLEEWKKIPGSEEINALYTVAPYNYDEIDVAKGIYQILKQNGNEDIKFEKVFETMLLSRIMKANNGTKRKAIPTTFNEFRSEIYELKESAKNETDLIKREQTIQRLTQMLFYLETGVATLRSLEKLGVQTESAVAQIESIRSLGALTTEQADALTMGYLEESETLKIKEEIEFSSNENIRAIQEKLTEIGAPAYIVNKAESKIIAGVYAAFEGTDIKGAGAGIKIPLGEGYSIGYGLNQDGPMLGVSYNEGDATIGAGANIERVAFTATDGLFTEEVSLNTNGELQNFLGLTPTIAIAENTDLSLLFGLNLGITPEGLTPNAILGVGLSDNENRVRLKEYQASRREHGFLEVDNEVDINEKTKKIRELPQFKQFNSGETQLEDADLIYLYEKYKEQDALFAEEKADEESGLIKSIGLGISFPPPTGFAGITIEIGQTKIILPKYGERERLAKDYSSQKIEALIKDKRENASSSKEYSATSGEIYLTKDGRYAIRNGKRLDIDFSESNVDEMNTALKDARMTTEIIEKDGKQYYKLNIADRNLGDVEFHIDRRANIQIAFDEESQSILLPPQALSNLVLTRSTFNFAHRNKEGGSIKTDIIILTTREVAENQNFDIQAITDGSSELLASYWENNTETKYRNEKGVSQAELNTVTENDAGFEGAKETYSGKTQEEWEDVSSDTDRARQSLNQIETSQDSISRYKSIEEIQTIYKEIEGKLKAKPTDAEFLKVNDPEQVINAVNEYLKEKGEAPLNTKEAQEVYSGIVTEYFTDLWTRKGKEGIKSQFEAHTNWIVTKVLTPEFQEKLTKLGLEPNDEVYAETLARLVQSEARDNLNAKLDSLSDEQIKNKDFEFTDLPEGFMMLIGTNYRGQDRAQKEGVMAKLIGGNSTIEGMKTIGLLGKETEWKLSAKPGTNEYNLARILLESASPVPSLENLETFKSPIALKLYTFEATRLFMGDGAYNEIIKFYEGGANEQSLATVNKPAIEKFAKFVGIVRNAQINNFDAIQIEQNPDIYLNITTPEIASGAYADCGNLTLMAKEEFGLSVKYENKFYAVATSEEVNPDIIKRIEEIEIGLGVSFKPSPEHPEYKKNPEEGVEATPNPNKDPSEGVGQEVPSQDQGTIAMPDEVISWEDLQKQMNQ